MIHPKLVRALLSASAKVSLSRKKQGPLCPDWSWFFEIGTTVLRHVAKEGMELKEVSKQRKLYDQYHLPSPSLLKVWFEPSDFQEIKGRWISPKLGHTHQRVILYLHGGGYVFYSKFHDNLMSWISHYTRTRLFALDYPLAPEAPYPAALDYAVKCYQAFLDRYADANNIILMGDSAGGGLVLSLLQKLREKGIELPDKAVLLSPWVDLTDTDKVTLENNVYDWVDGKMGEEWARFYSNGKDLKDPLLSPLFADLKGLPEIYIQYGSKESIKPQIEKLIQHGTSQGVKIHSDCFQGMNHNFQYFGNLVPQSKDALNKIVDFLAIEKSKNLEPSP